MSEQLPAPMTPADCDLTDFKFMPLLVGRLRDSDLASEQTPEENWAAVLLWGASWHQVPAASVPDVDATIAKWAGYMMRGKIDARWKEVRKGAMRGFVLCSDGRWYHPVVAEVAREAWTGKLKQRLKTECNRIKKHNERHGTRLPFPDFDTWLAAGCPVGQPLPVPGDTRGLSPATPPPCHLEYLSKGQGEGQGEGQGQGFIEPTGGYSPPPAGGGLPDLLEDEARDIPKTVPPCPHLAVLKLWAEVLPNLPQHDPDHWNETRRKHLQTRWRETATAKKWQSQDDGMAFFRRLFGYVGKSAFLTGRAGQRDPNRPPFVIELEWLILPTNWAKVIEGKYHQET